MAEDDDQPKITNNSKYEWRLNGNIIRNREEEVENENVKEVLQIKERGKKAPLQVNDDSVVDNNLKYGNRRGYYFNNQIDE